MLHAFGQLLQITSQNNPTMLPDFALKCCVCLARPLLREFEQIASSTLAEL